MSEGTNIVVVHTDDTGRYVGPYGHDIETPNIQELAEDGVLFRNAYCAGPTCSPSRGALLTGSSPHSNGLVGLAHRGFEMDDYDRHLSNYLTERGFETVLSGQQHEVAEDAVEGNAARDVLGYDRVLDGDEDAVGELPLDHEPTRTDLANAHAAADYVRETGAAESSDPFFLSLGLYNTHQSMPLDQDLVDPDYVATPGPIPDREPLRAEMAAFHALAQYVDECFGLVADALDATGQLDDTLLLFTTDHGVPFPRMKCHLYDGGIGVSLVGRFPEGAAVPRGVAEDALVSQIDLFPTFCDLLDVEVPEWVEGESLLPLLRDDVDAVRDEVYGEVTYHAAYEPKRCIRTERYKYIRRFDEEYDRYVMPNTDDGPMKQFLIDHGFYDRRPPREELYDLYHDPNERNNLVDDPEYGETCDDLRSRLERWMERTDDPLLEGPVPKPDGAVADRQAALHPGAEYEPTDAR